MSCTRQFYLLKLFVFQHESFPKNFPVSLPLEKGADVLLFIMLQKVVLF